MEIEMTKLYFFMDQNNKRIVDQNGNSYKPLSQSELHAIPAKGKKYVFGGKTYTVQDVYESQLFGDPNHNIQVDVVLK